MPSPVERGDPPPALFSIHDVMPETMTLVADALARLRACGADTVTLLVVPGRLWQEKELAQLRAWSRDGCELAGHGWVHRRGPIRTWGHRLHSLFLSRDAAEHLSRPREEVVAMVARCGEWFAEHELPRPELYVPPAWALGAMHPEDLSETPFRYLETLGGVYDATTRRHHSLPLVGFEADTLARAVPLRLFNAASRCWARWRRAPLRIGIHPHDFSLRLAATIEPLARGPWRSMGYGELGGD